MLDLNSAGAEPHYLGSSSSFAFSRVISPCLRQTITTKRPTLFGSEQNTTTPLTCLLPEYSDGVALSNAYFQNIHPQYPFLHEPTFRNWERNVVGHSEIATVDSDPIPLFFVNMVYAVGALLQPNPGSLPQQLYLSAQLYIDHMLSFDNLEAIQAILCCAMYSLRSPTGPSIWKLSGLALRQCIELGYHRTVKRFGSTTNPLRLELRKRVFWCAYGIDCAVSMSLGRPLGLPLQEVDAEFPMDIFDSNLTDTEICGTARDTSDETPTTMTTAIHVFRLRCLWARIHTSLYSKTETRSYDHPTDTTRTEQLCTELENWLASVPPIAPRVGDALSIFASQDWFDLNYSYSILHLYRIQLTDKRGAADDVVRKCLHAAENICHGYRRQYFGKPVNYTWGALRCLFMAGMTYLHCLWASPTVRETTRYDDVSSTCTDCMIVLMVMTERWEGAGAYWDIFEALVKRTMTMVVERNYERGELPTQSLPLDDLDLGSFTQWMGDMANIGMSDGIDEYWIGSMGDFTSHEQELASPEAS